MQFKTWSDVNAVIQDMWIVDRKRSENRAFMNSLANGFPPYTDEEARDNRISVNVNFLQYPKILHDADRQYKNAFKSTSNFFTVGLDWGPIVKRESWGGIITSGINRRMKKSHAYNECLNGVIGNTVLHGLGVSSWVDRHMWVPNDHMVGDVLVPSNTLRSLTNLECFAIKRRYTTWELFRLTHGPRTDPAWNMPMVNSCLRWALKQTATTRSALDLMNPEVVAEEFKANGGAYTIDNVPVIECWDFYFLADDGKQLGWQRRIIPEMTDEIERTDGMAEQHGRRPMREDLIENEDANAGYLFNSQKRCYAKKWSEIMHVQFGDASRVPPYRWHSVRSLGWLLYSVCHLENRMRCRFDEHVFSALLQYFRAGQGQEELVKKLDLTNYGAIPEEIKFMPANERWAVDQNLVETAMLLHRQSMSDVSLAYTQDYNFENDKTRKTATQFMGETSSTNAMVAEMLNEGYIYEKARHEEICRRFCIKNSRDPDVRAFRAECLHKGIPEEYLEPDCWIITPERVIGSGNEQLAIARANMLMSQVNRFDPSSQKTILRLFAFAATRDAGLTEQLVPISPVAVTDSVHDAQQSIGTLMLGLDVQIKPGMNHIEYVETLIFELAALLSQVEQSGGMTDAQHLLGFVTIVRSIQQHIAIVAQDKIEKERVTIWQKDLAKLENLIKGYEQRLMEQQKAQQTATTTGGEADPTAAAKAQAIIQQAQVKAQLTMQTHGQKMQMRAEQNQQKQAGWQAEQARKKEAHDLEMQQKIGAQQVQDAATDLRTASEIQRKQAQSAAQNTKPKES